VTANRVVVSGMAALILATSLAGCVKRVRARPELAGEAGYHTVSILPPMVSIDKSKMTGWDNLTAESLMMEETILTLLFGELLEKGYDAKPTLSLERLNQDPELKKAVADLETRYEELLPAMSRDLKGVEEGRFSLGEDVPVVGAAAEADLLVFVRAQGVVVSGGQKAFWGILSLGQSVPRDYLHMLVTLVDARDGRVMATVNGDAYGGFIKYPEDVVGRALDKAFRKFPARAAVPGAGPAKPTGDD